MISSVPLGRQDYLPTSHTPARYLQMEITEWKSRERAGRPLYQKLTRVTRKLPLPICGLLPHFYVQSAPLSTLALCHYSQDRFRSGGCTRKPRCIWSFTIPGGAPAISPLAVAMDPSPLLNSQR